MRLPAYLRAHHLKRIEFGRLLGVHADSVSKWCKGRRPREKQLIAIYRVTRGAVTPNDFYRLPNLPEGGADAAQ
jgi:DNA-binding transcriptional regulator YdaS (Cro superfamily)